ncbi:hypothetical protein [Thermus sp.]|uniref:hypothetical protein n=1 Tax=Thermus sp. TaxID=275 RepID=UPI003D141A09
MKRWIDRGPKWVRWEPFPRVEYQPSEAALKELLARPLAPKAPGYWIARARGRRG